MGWGMDVEERDDSVIVHADAPGFEPGDFDLQVRDHELILCACHSSDKKEGEEGRSWERRQLRHAISLPSGIDPEKVDAQYKNGVLTVTLPKSEKARGRRIEVKS